jgi:hypothetical protein
MTSPFLDAEAKAFASDPVRAKVYVNFDNARGNVTLQVILDGRIVCSLAPRSYALLAVAPGQHTLSEAGALEKVETVSINAEAGKLYFCKLSVKAGWINPRAHLTLLDAGEGKKRLMKSKRAEVLDSAQNRNTTEDVLTIHNDSTPLLGGLAERQAHGKKDCGLETSVRCS